MTRRGRADVEPRERVERHAQHRHRAAARRARRRSSARASARSLPRVCAALYAIFLTSSPMRSRSLTILLTVRTMRRSTAAGWRRAMICAHCWSMSICSWLIAASSAPTASSSVASRPRCSSAAIARVELLLDQAAHRQHAGADRLPSRRRTACWCDRRHRERLLSRSGR